MGASRKWTNSAKIDMSEAQAMEAAAASDRFESEYEDHPFQPGAVALNGAALSSDDTATVSLARLTNIRLMDLRQFAHDLDASRSGRAL